MNTVKTRKVGNSLAVTIPKELGVDEGKEFVVYKGIDDIIVLAPKISNPFDNMDPFTMDNDFEGVVMIDNED
ncbi:TPA: AbrB/MazE/SpoVT family DNA-binding domain-containing protein [Streptococcus agalactiae]|nr:AbrB/MazE/SpoVT family DNA-binding domain-containing protein [Streptococcus agalactiae]